MFTPETDDRLIDLLRTNEPESEHPLLRLERAALEYAKAAARSSGADIRAGRFTGDRVARADVRAAKARRHKIDCSTLLQHAACAFADWSKTPLPDEMPTPVSLRVPGSNTALGQVARLGGMRMDGEDDE